MIKGRKFPYCPLLSLDLSSLFADPFAEIGWKILEFHSTPLAKREKAYRMAVDQCYFLQIQSYFTSRVFEQPLKRRNVFPFDPTTHPKNDGAIVNHESFDPASHRQPPSDCFIRFAQVHSD